MTSCTLEIIDEVNCKFVGLDVETRRRLVKMFKYELPHARFMPAVRLGRWDGKKAFFQLHGATFINLLPEIIPYLEDRGIVVDLEDKREPQQNFEFQEVATDVVSHITWPAGHVAAGKPIMLRDYQVEVVNTFLHNTQTIQQISTGAGKTLVTAVLSKQCEKYGKTVVIVPNTTLVTQTEEDYKNIGLDVGVYFGDRKELGHTHTICTWQSLKNLIDKENEGLGEKIQAFRFIDGVIAVIVDECHAAKAEVLHEILTGYMAGVPLRWGLTGTIPKEEFAKATLKVSLGECIKKLNAKELQDKEVLATCNVNILQTQEHVEFKSYPSELQFLTTDADRLDYIAKKIEEIRKSGNTLVLVDRISAGQELQQRITDSVFVSGSTKASKRKDHYQEIISGGNKVIIASYGVAAVGINIVSLYNIVLIEPGKSFVRTIQSIGRGLRKGHDKTHVEIWDITSNCKFSKRHLTKRKQFYTEVEYPYTTQKVKY